MEIKCRSSDPKLQQGGSRVLSSWFDISVLLSQLNHTTKKLLQSLSDILTVCSLLNSAVNMYFSKRVFESRLPA